MMPFVRHANIQKSYTDDLQTRIMVARKQNLAYKKVLAESMLQKDKRYQIITSLERKNVEFSQQIPESNNISFPINQQTTEAMTRNLNQLPATPMHTQILPNSASPLATSTSLPSSHLYDTVELPRELSTNNNNKKTELQYERKKKWKKLHNNNKFKQRPMKSENNSSSDKKLSESLITILNTIQSTIDDNTTSLNTSLNIKNQTNDKSQPTKNNDLELARKKDLRNKIKSFLDKNKDEEKELPIPLWRHILKGNHTPPTSTILKPKAIFRSIVWSIVLLVTHPYLTYTKKKLISKQSEQSAFASTLLLYQEACTLWLGKLVKVPMLSIQSDNSLDFHIHIPDQHHHHYFSSIFYGNNTTHNSNSGSNTTSNSECYPHYYYEGKKRLSMQEKLLQIKVRVKCIIKAVTSTDPRASNMELNNNNKNNTKLLASESVTVDASLPPAHIVDFLASLAEDGNFYASDFLYDFEKQLLEFDRFGAVTHMLPVITKLDTGTDTTSITSSSSSKNNTATSTENNVPSTQLPVPLLLPPASVTAKQQVMTINEQCLDVCRFRLLLQNFLLIRILLDNVFLHPWHFGLCPIPSSHNGTAATTPHKDNTLYNYRMIASILYEIFLRADPQLPLIHHEIIIKNTTSVSHIEEQSLSTSVNKIRTRLSIVTKSEPRSSVTFRKSALGHSVMGTATPSNARRDALKNITAIDNMTTNSRNSNSNSMNATTSKNPTVWLGRLIGMARNTTTTDTTDKDNNSYYEELCNKMLDTKETPFSTLQDIHNLLFDFNSLVHAKFYMESWIDELAVEVRNWIDRIVLHTLLVRLEKKKHISIAQV